MLSLLWRRRKHDKSRGVYRGPLAGELSKKLKYVIDALHTAKDAHTYAFRYGDSFEVRFGEYSVEEVPKDIAVEALDLIIKRLEGECNKIEAEIEAM